jgi:hypothetical protein
MDTPDPNAAPTAPADAAPAPAEPTPVDPAGLTPEQWGAIIALCGLTPDATPDDVVASVQDLVNVEQASAGAPSAIVAAARSRGLEVLDSDAVAVLKRDAAEGRKIVAKAAQDRREGIWAAALARGAVSRVRRQHWFDLMASDAEYERILANAPANAADPGSELGHGVDGDYGHGGGYQPGAWVK